MDAVQNGRTVTSAIDRIVRPNMGSYAFDLPLDLAGSVQLQAYAILEDGDIVRDTKLIQVHRADQLRIEATLDAETYKPSEKALINFLVTSKNGDPVAAALSLAAVDEAVFALNDGRPGLGRDVLSGAGGNSQTALSVRDSTAIRLSCRTPPEQPNLTISKKPT